MPLEKKGPGPRANPRLQALPVLKWLRAQAPPCPWDEWVSMAAASGGHLRLLKWLRREQAPWSERTWYWAAMDGRLRVLRWMRSRRLPGGETAREGAERGGHSLVLRWMDAQGPPFCGA